MFKISIGVFAHNEEKNIKGLLESLVNQELKNAQLVEIIVVSSSTDRTNQIIKEVAKRHRIVKLIAEKKRQGKASAINQFLKVAQGDLCILESGDTLPLKNTVSELIKPFYSPQVGMAGVHPLPVDNPRNFLGFTTHLLWRIHHQIALKEPKCGEMIAIRKGIVKEIPSQTAVDEAMFEALISKKGYKVVYVPSAIVRNKGPETVTDFLKQRRRITAGHLHLRKKMCYSVSTTSPLKIFKYVLSEIKKNPTKFHFILGAIFLEGWGRLLGYYDFYFKKKNPYKWEIAESTKEDLKNVSTSS